VNKIAFYLMAESWLDQEVVNPTTGNKVKVRSLPAAERAKYKPKSDVLHAPHSFTHAVDKETLMSVPKSVKQEVIDRHITTPTVKFTGKKEDIEKTLRMIDPSYSVRVKNHGNNKSSFYDPMERRIK